MSGARFPRQGLYAITRDGYGSAEALAEAVAAAIRGGAGVIQYRAKRASDPLGEARRLAALCQECGVPFIVNDDVDLAARSGADGVHLGRHDPDLAAARKRLGLDAILGVSCYASVARAVEAEAAGASYVAFGRFFPSVTKPGAPPAPVEVLTAARERVRLPLVAIGGITVANGPALLAAGADLLAVIEAVFGRADPESAAAAFRPLFPALP